MLSDYSQARTVVCILCKAWISVKKAADCSINNTRFQQHMLNDHEVHFDLEFLFSLSFLGDKDRATIKENVHNLYNQNVVSAVEDPEPSPPTEEEYDSLGDLLDSELSDDDDSNTKDVEKETRVPVMKKARIDVQNLSMEYIQQHTRLDDNEVSLMKCSKSNKRMKRSALNPHLSSAHKKVTLKRKPTVECQLCEQKISKQNMSRHLKNVHNIQNLNHDTINDQFKSLENSQKGKPFKREGSEVEEAAVEVKQQPPEESEPEDEVVSYEDFSRILNTNQHLTTSENINSDPIDESSHKSTPLLEDINEELSRLEDDNDDEEQVQVLPEETVKNLPGVTIVKEPVSIQPTERIKSPVKDFIVKCDSCQKTIFASKMKRHQQIYHSVQNV